MKKVRVFLFAASLLMFSGCANFLNDKFDFKDTLREHNEYARVFNVTSDSTDSTAPNWNVIFPPVLRKDFYLYKGIVQDGKIDYSASTTERSSFEGLKLDYGRGWAAMLDHYVSSTGKLYLSSDDDGSYAYQMQTHDGTSTSKLFYPKDIISIKCKSFERNASYYSWEFEFSEQPDSLYFAQARGTLDVPYKSFWKLPSYYGSYGNRFDEFAKLDSASSNFTTARGGGYAAIFAKYGDYYVRVTPVLE